MIQLTFEAFQNKEMFENYSEATSNGFEEGEYEENYLDNLFIDHFVQTKFLIILLWSKAFGLENIIIW